MRRAGSHQGVRSDRRRTASLARGPWLQHQPKLQQVDGREVLLSEGEALPPSAVRGDKEALLGATRSKHGSVVVVI